MNKILILTLICAVLLPGICKKNSNYLPDMYKNLSRLINKDGSDEINKFIDFLYDINRKLNIPFDFKDFSISHDQVLSDFSRFRVNRSSIASKLHLFVRPGAHCAHQALQLFREGCRDR